MAQITNLESVAEERHIVVAGEAPLEVVVPESRAGGNRQERRAVQMVRSTIRPNEPFSLTA